VRHSLQTEDALRAPATQSVSSGPLPVAELSDQPQLATYGYLAAAKADFLRRLGRNDEARAAYEEALTLTENIVERQFLSSRIEELGQ
jgi:predicted RNA polymerase sigma factor